MRPGQEGVQAAHAEPVGPLAGGVIAGEESLGGPDSLFAPANEKPHIGRRERGLPGNQVPRGQTRSPRDLVHATLTGADRADGTGRQRAAA